MPNENSESTELSLNGEQDVFEGDEFGLNQKDARGIFWRSFSLLGSQNYERMEGLGFLYAILPELRKIYKDDAEGLKAAMHRHLAAFNMTVAPSPFVMGLSVAMEEDFKRNPEADPASVNSLKVALMGPLSGIGDTFFWGIFRILACSLALPFAQQGSPIAPLVLLLVFNIPNFLTRWFGLRIGYRSGAKAISSLEKSGKMELFMFCAGIVGAVSVAAMIAISVTITCPLQFTLGDQTFAIQDYLDEIIPCLLPLLATLGVYFSIKRGVKNSAIIIALVIIGFALGATGLISLS
jgi:mannose/fructose/N-acetylgalactosamine-specific phosphotransferase system component IID